MQPTQRMFMKDSEFPHAILHIDGDAFFASCEVARRPELYGKPVVVGAERGIVTACTYEAKGLGVKRGMPIARIRRHFPDVIVLPSDYQLYAKTSARMMEIVRRHTPEVEPYSIDECFADITGFHLPRKLSYDAMVQVIKQELQSELGMSFSCGLAPTKALAKVASTCAKPNGYTIIPVSGIERVLTRVPIEQVWGIGQKTSIRLKEDGVITALAFINKPEHWVATRFTKPLVELWRELRGESLWNVRSRKHHQPQSLMHTRTFTPPSSDRIYLLKELAQHAESVCAAARDEGLVARQLTCFLRTQRFTEIHIRIKLLTPTNVPTDLIPIIEQHIDNALSEGEYYRAAGIILHQLIPESAVTHNLFDTTGKSDRLRRVYEKIDTINARYGHTVVTLATSGARRKGAAMKHIGPRETQSLEHIQRMPFVPHD